MNISTASALVTDANRGLGRPLAQQLLSRGASVYGAARHPDQLDTGLKPVQIDVTNPASVAAAVCRCYFRDTASSMAAFNWPNHRPRRTSPLSRAPLLEGISTRLDKCSPCWPLFKVFKMPEGT
jgi:nucleoside-diphosphate-sugar epimerase